MIKGQEVWNVHVTKGMEMRTIGNRQVCTFSDMKNNYYEILEETAEKFPDKIGFSDNWNRAYTYGTFIGMVDDFAQWLTEKGLQRGQHVGMLLHNSIEFCTVFYAICKIGAGYHTATIEITATKTKVTAKLMTSCSTPIPHADRSAMAGIPRL